MKEIFVNGQWQGGGDLVTFDGAKEITKMYLRRIREKRIFREYNKTDDSELDKQQKLLMELCNSIGKNVWIEPDFRCEFGSNISIGNNVYINFGCIILDCAEVQIGDNTLLGPNLEQCSVKQQKRKMLQKVGFAQSEREKKKPDATRVYTPEVLASIEELAWKDFYAEVKDYRLAPLAPPEEY